MRGLLLEVIPTTVEILESSSDGVMRVKATMQLVDTRNRNRRVYRRDLIERELTKFQEKIKSRESFGAGDHPKDGRTLIPDVASLWDRVQLLPDKRVVGEARIIPTQKGKDLQAIMRAGGAVGVSARGFGETTLGEWEGEPAEIVNEDYELMTYDFVIGGGFPEAKAHIVREEDPLSRAERLMLEEALRGSLAPPQPEGGGETMTEIKSLDQLRAAYPSLIAQLLTETKKTVEEELLQQFEERVASKISEEKALITEHVKRQLEEELGVEPMRETLRMIAEAMLPWIEVGEGEGKGTPGAGGAEDGAAVTQLKEELARSQEALEAEKTQSVSKVGELQKVLDTQEAGRYLEEVLKTADHASLLREELTGLSSKKAIDDALPGAKAKVQRIVETLKPKQEPGKGLVEDQKTTDHPVLTEQQKQQRRMAGVVAG